MFNILHIINFTRQFLYIEFDINVFSNMDHESEREFHLQQELVWVVNCEKYRC